MSAALAGTASSPEWQEVELSITGMTCAACAARVEKKLGALDDVAVADTVKPSATAADADLGLALGSGTDVAISAADLILLRDDLGVIPDAIRLARPTAGRPGRGRRLGSAPGQAEAAEPQQETLPCPG